MRIDFLKKNKRIAKIQAETNNLENTNSIWPLKESPIFTKAKDVPQKKETENANLLKKYLSLESPCLS